MFRAVCTLFSFVLLAASSAHAANSCERYVTVAIVDAYSSGQFLPEAVYDYVQKVAPGKEPRIIHIHSNGKPRNFQEHSFTPGNFDADYAYDGDLTQLVKWLAAFSPDAIFPGAESGVLLADQVSTIVHAFRPEVPSNGVLLARRDKYTMAEVLKAAGIPTVLQMKPTKGDREKNADEAVEWAKKNNLWPGIVVVKPAMSSGAEGVHFCRDEAELRAAMKKLYGAPTKYADANIDILVQEYLDGPEYVVNTVSSRGKHVVSDMWLYQKRIVEGAGTIYDMDRTIPFRGEVQDQLVAYIFRVLDALGISTGWGHAEVKMTKRGPVLVEIGARLMGADLPRLVDQAQGQSQLGLGIMAFLDPNGFQSLPTGFIFKKPAALVTISSDETGAKMSYAVVPELVKLPGYVRHHFMYDEGAKVKRTVDMATELGHVELVHEDKEILERSIQTLRRWEREGRFKTRP